MTMKHIRTKFRCVLEVTFPCDEGSIGAQCSLPLGQEDDCDEVPDLGCVGGEPMGPQSLCDEPPPGQPVCFDILSFHSEFELNAIPTAIVSVAIGRRLSATGVQLARIHYYIDCIKTQLPAVVWCEATDGIHCGSDPNNPWPAGKFKIFEGYATGSGFRRSSKGAELTLSLTHWLVDLNFSSAVSRQSHPLNQSQFYYPANYSAESANTGGGQLPPFNPIMIPAQRAAPFFSTSTIFTDFWGGAISPCVHFGGGLRCQGLKAWFLNLTRDDRINSAQINQRIVAAGGGANLVSAQRNWEACRALNRIEPDAVSADFDERGQGYVLGIPLGMVTTSIDSFIANNIAIDIGRQSQEAFTNTTFWDKLVGHLHADYSYALVPLIEKALIVPHVPCLSSGDDDTLVHRVIQADEYESIDMQSLLIRPLRGVGIIVGSQAVAGGSIPGEQVAQFSTISLGGWFDRITAGSRDSAYQQGLIMFKQGPTWMTTVVDYPGAAGATVGMSNTIRTATSPTAGVPPTIPAPRDTQNAAKTIWDLWAQTEYIHEVLKQRQGVISGPVRFDIAPGSAIKVEIAEDKYVKEIFTGLPAACTTAHHWCHVMRVSTTIDCQNMNAKTSFYVSHIRNRAENRDPATSIAKHPLWQAYQWAGCALVQDPAFEPLTTNTFII